MAEVPYNHRPDTDDPEDATHTPDAGQMSDETLMSVIREYDQESYGYDSGQLAAARAYAIERYLAEPYGDEQDGRSGVVDTGLRDTIEWLLPQVLRVFLSGDEVVKFNPTSAEDEQGADQETKYVNHVILEKNDSFNFFSTWFRDALMTKVGYAKAYWKEASDILKETYEGQCDDVLMFLQQDPEIQIVSIKSYPDPYHQQPPQMMQQMMPGPQGMQPQQPPPPPMLHDVVVRRVKQRSHVAIDNVPAEEIRIHRSLRTIGLSDCQFIRHRAKRTISQLRQDGYDIPDDLPMSAMDDAGTNMDQITISRDRFEDDDDLREDMNTVDPAARRVWFSESYLRVDYDGDGIAELRKVCHINAKIISNEETDQIPFAAVTPIIFPHRHIGIGYDELCDQNSLIATAVKRGYLDNLYLQNNGRYGIDVTKVNVDDMLQSRPGGLVRTEGAPGESIFPFTHPAAGDAALAGLEAVQRWQVMATGVSPDQSNMTADALHGATATGIAQGVSAGQMRVEAVTRSFASGVKDLFAIVHALTLKNQTCEDRAKIGGQWVAVDPREWVKRTSLSIVVGLGTGTREYRAQLLMQQGQMQQAGMQIGICKPENLYNTGRQYSQALGFPNPDEFWSDPAKNPPPPPPPPPYQIQVAQIKAQSDQTIAQGKGMADQQNMQTQAAVDHAKSVAQQQTEQAQMQADMMVARMQAQMKAATDENRNQLEAQRSLMETKYNMQLEAFKQQAQQQTAIIVAHINAASKIAAAEASGVKQAQDQALAREQAGER